MRRLCRADEIAEGTARGFPPPPGGLIGLFAVRSAGELRVFVNACPHLGVPLDWAPDQFLTDDRALIICGTHGAVFRPGDGHCLRGPCRGDSLEAVPVTLIDGWIEVPEDAGT